MKAMKAKGSSIFVRLSPIVILTSSNGQGYEEGCGCAGGTSHEEGDEGQGQGDESHESKEVIGLCPSVLFKRASLDACDRVVQIRCCDAVALGARMREVGAAFAEQNVDVTYAKRIVTRVYSAALR